MYQEYVFKTTLKTMYGDEDGRAGGHLCALLELLALALLEQGLPLLGPLDAPAQGQHALQGLLHWPAVRLSLLGITRTAHVTHTHTDAHTHTHTHTHTYIHTRTPMVFTRYCHGIITLGALSAVLELTT